MRCRVKELGKLGVVQNSVGRLPVRCQQVRNNRGEVRWSTFEERIGKALLKYKMRMGKMNENR